MHFSYFLLKEVVYSNSNVHLTFFILVSTRILARQTFLARIRTIIWNVKTGEKDEEKEQERKLQEEMVIEITIFANILSK